MGSFLPTNIDTKKGRQIIEGEFLKQPETHNWTIGSEPLSEFSVQFLASMAFPTLFPDGEGDPTNIAVVSDISNNSTQSFAERLKHLIKFAEYIDGKWIYRFASHPRFAYWAYNMLYRKRILGQSSFFLKQNPTEANLTIDELKQMMMSDSYESLISKLMHYAKNVSGTNAYWNRAKDDLKAIITEVVAPTIFWTLSCAEFHWPKFHDLMSTQNPTNPDITWVKPKNQPCKIRFEDIQNDWDNDYENLVNLVQRHTNCSTAYCLRKKGESDELSCRFDFPKEICEKTHLEHETFKTKDGKEHYKVKVVTKKKRWSPK